MQMLDKDLVGYADSIGYRFVYADLRARGREAMCHRPTSTIYVQHGLLYRKERSLGAHELGHAVLKHDPSIFDHVHRKQEAKADEWAAHFLIDANEYRLAEERFGSNTEWLAQELNVLEKLVTAYERTLRRIGNKVYVNPKLGRGAGTVKFNAVA